MDTHQDVWDRLALLLVSKPEEGFEDLYKRLVRREIERMTPGEEGNLDRLLAEKDALEEEKRSRPPR
jgi:hypothetical protein